MLRKGYSFSQSVRLKSGPQILEMLKLGKSLIFEKNVIEIENGAQLSDKIAIL